MLIYEAKAIFSYISFGFMCVNKNTEKVFEYNVDSNMFAEFKINIFLFKDDAEEKYETHFNIKIGSCEEVER